MGLKLPYRILEPFEDAQESLFRAIQNRERFNSRFNSVQQVGNRPGSVIIEEYLRSREELVRKYKALPKPSTIEQIDIKQSIASLLKEELSWENVSTKVQANHLADFGGLRTRRISL